MKPFQLAKKQSRAVLDCLPTLPYDNASLLSECDRMDNQRLRFFTIYGHEEHLGHVTKTIRFHYCVFIPQGMGGGKLGVVYEIWL